MYKDVTIGAIFLSVSLAMFGLTFTFPDQTIALPPTAFPRFVTVCMTIFSSILIYQSWPRSAPELGAPAKPLLERLRDGAVIRIAAMAVLGFLYTEIIDSLGYLITTGLFLAGSVLIFMERRLRVILPVAVIGTGVLYAVFRMLFKVPLPRFDLF